jgi:hypothetical protein|tara:strand:+ start:691 stop:1083 length:393 start_codon:yes stop_codon:yes gene_type:complete
MDKQEPKIKKARSEFSQEQRKAMLTVLGQPASRSVFQRKNRMTRTLPTTYPERNGSVKERSLKDQKNKGVKMRKEEKFINLAPKAIRVAVKAIRFARGGFDDNEKAELGEDLLELALLLLTSLADAQEEE